MPEGRLHLVKLGGPCEIVLDAFPAVRFRGEAMEIVPKVNRAKATVTVKVIASPGVSPKSRYPSPLKPGRNPLTRLMFVRAIQDVHFRRIILPNTDERQKHFL